MSKKITKLPALETPAVEDSVAIVDFGASTTKEITLENLFGGMPKSTVTKVVAASNTPNADSRADYVCDGINDEVEIQAALDALPALGGKVHLLEGEYILGGNVGIPSYASLVGSGSGTWVRFDFVQDKGFYNVDGPAGNWYITISDMKIDGMGKTNDPIEFTNSNKCLFHNLWIHDGVHDGLELGTTCHDNIISNVISYSHDTFHGIEIDDGSYNNIVINCIVYDCPAAGIVIDGTSHDNVIVGCISRDNIGYGIQLNVNTADNIVVGNLTEGNVAGHVLDSGTDNTVIAYADGNIGFGTGAPAGKYHIDQAVADAAIPTLVLDQADISEGFINFIGSDRGVIGEGTNSTVSVRVELGGVVYRLALYADA